MKYATYIVSQGKMEHGGKMEHRVFWKKTCQAWVYFQVHLIIILIDAHVFPFVR